MNIIHLLVTVVAGFAISSLLGIWLIPFLRRLHFGQTILEIGPSWHKKKQGTPTMGGFMFLAGSLLAATAGYFAVRLQSGPEQPEPVGFWYLVTGFMMAIAFGLLGFLDDYIKAVKKRNLGLKEGQKLIGQFAIAVAYLAAQACFDPTTMVWIPFIGEFDFGIFYYPVMLFVIIGAVNAVNLTDGLDGLAGSVTFVASMGFMIISAILSQIEMNLMAGALAGACLGFLVWNFYPAKVFMGDTGSMYLGGMVVSMAFGLRMPVILLFIGIIYVVETVSDIIQITSFKLTGKRVFKMCPIHHHFELSGWSEVKIVAVFSFITVLGCGMAVWAVLVK